MRETEWFSGASIEAPQPSLTVLPWLFWVAIALAMILAPLAYAEPVYQAGSADGTLRIVLHDEKCALAEIANLPRRATWTEGAKTYEGCWGARPDQGIVLAYFTDKTVVAVPVQAFSKVTGT